MTQVSTGATCFARETYPNPVEYHPLTPFHLDEQCSETILRTIMQPLRTFHDRLYIFHKTMDDAQRLCSSYPSLVLG